MIFVPSLNNCIGSHAITLIIKSDQLAYLRALRIPLFIKRDDEARLLWLVDAIDSESIQTLLSKMTRVITKSSPFIYSSPSFSLDDLEKTIQRIQPHAILIAGAHHADELFQCRRSLDEWRETIQHSPSIAVPIQITFTLLHLSEHPLDKKLAYRDLLQLNQALGRVPKVFA